MRKLSQVLLVIAGCMALCFGVVSLVVGLLHGLGYITLAALSAPGPSVGLVVGGLALMLGAKKLV